MKLKNIVCTLLCGVLFLAGCAQPLKEYEQIEITYDELKEKLEAKDTFVLEVYRENCPFCEKVANYIEETKQEHPGTVLYRIDCTDWELKTNEEGDALISESDLGKVFLKEYPGFYYTPTFYAYENGEVVESGVGFNEINASVAIWEVDSVVDFEIANLQHYWEFIQTYQN